MDAHTVDSYYPQLEEAYWIDPQRQKELPKVGIASLEDLVSRTNQKKERDELALRLLVPKEEFLQWVEKAKLVQLKGIGIENLRLLEGAEIHSVAALAAENAERLYRIREFISGRRSQGKQKSEYGSRKPKKS
jgi:predicted RecB family nuclease